MKIKEQKDPKIIQSFKTKDELCGDIWEGTEGSPKMVSEIT